MAKHKCEILQHVANTSDQLPNLTAKQLEHSNDGEQQKVLWLSLINKTHEFSRQKRYDGGPLTENDETNSNGARLMVVI